MDVLSFRPVDSEANILLLGDGGDLALDEFFHVVDLPLVHTCLQCFETFIIHELVDSGLPDENAENIGSLRLDLIVQVLDLLPVPLLEVFADLAIHEVS